MRYINLAVEDALSDAVARRLVGATGGRLAVAHSFGWRGCGYLKKKIRAFNNASRFTPFFVLTDLDAGECAPELVARWLYGVERSENLLLRVAVREVEAWLLADRQGFAKFLGLSPDALPDKTDAIQDPKRELLKLVASSKKRDLKEDILPPEGRRMGPGYNSRLADFVFHLWNPAEAKRRNSSLGATLLSLRRLAETE
jgi:hypothetical protein